MNKTLTLSIGILSLLHSSIKAQSPASYGAIATWKGFAKAAISYTWDDNTPKQLTDALPIFDRYGFKTTFFVITSTSPDWNGLKQAQTNGHEIASHTITHSDLSTLPDSTQEKEQQEAQQEINTRLMNTKCITLAYPYCAAGNKSITEKYYISARGCSGQIENTTPSDFYNISSVICGAQGAIKTSQDFNSSVNAALSMNGWAVYLLHGVNNDGGYSPIDSTELGKHLQYMNTNKNNFWVTTYENAVKYIRERDASVINYIDTTSQRDHIISITNTLDTAIYNFPLTIKYYLPNSFNGLNIFVTQNNKPVGPNGAELPIQSDDGGKTMYVVFDALPNKGTIAIKAALVGIAENKLITNFEIYPNPVNTLSTIQFELTKAAPVSLELCDASGKLIQTLIKQNFAAGMHQFSLDISTIQSTIIYAVLRTGNNTEVKKVLLNK